MATEGGKLGTFLRQLNQGMTLNLGDEGADAYGAYLAKTYGLGQKAIGKIIGDRGMENAGSDILNRPTSDMYNERRKESEAQLASDYKENPNISMAGNIVGSIPSGMVAGAKLLPQVGLGLISGYGAGNDGDRGASALTGGVFGLGGQLAGRALGRVAKGASDLIDPAVQATADKLKSLGIQPRLSQLLDNKLLKAVDSQLDKVPFSGAGSSQDAQRQAYTKALTNTFGQDASQITPDVLDAAKKQLGGEYDRILGGTNIPLDRAQFAQGLAPKIDEFGLATGDPAWAGNLQNSMLTTLYHSVDQTNGLTGESYQAMRGTLKNASKTNAQARELLKYLDDSVRQVAPDDIAGQLGKTDTQYRNMKIAEKLYGQNQNSTGVIDPGTVYNAAKSSIGNLASGGGGELGDLARMGRQLKQTIPDSGTASRQIGTTALALAGGAGYFNPAIAATAGGTVLAGRGINSMMKSDYLQQGMNPVIQGAAEGLENSGILPSIARGASNAGSAQTPYNPDQDPKLQQMMDVGYNPDNDPVLQKLLGGTEMASGDKQAPMGGDIRPILPQQPPMLPPLPNGLTTYIDQQEPDMNMILSGLNKRNR